MSKPLKWLKGLDLGKKVFITLGVIVLVGLAGSTNHTANLSSQTDKTAAAVNKQQATSSKLAHVPVITTKTETDTQTIPFSTTTVQSSALAKGTTKITTAGVNGSQTLSYELTYTDGKQTTKKLVSTTVTAQPITQVTSMGTYVAPAPSPAPSCPNGTYINSAGNTVCSPYSSPSAPAGATAQCVDGTYSFSQSRNGTCSHHGGVAQWL